MELMDAVMRKISLITFLPSIGAAELKQVTGDTVYCRGFLGSGV